MRKIRILTFCVLLCVGINLFAATRQKNGPISSVVVSPASFNPSVGEKVQIKVHLDRKGELAALILDRDGYPVRDLGKIKAEKAGDVPFTWDGRIDASEVVADEAYSLHLTFTSGGKTTTYFPANKVVEHYSVLEAKYNRQEGILSYRLPVASRIHAQAATAKIDPATKKVDGAVAKTICNRVPRPAGALIEHWNGMDESGTIYVPDLPSFVIGIAATPLPESSILAYGNRSKTFLETLSSRHGKSLITISSEHHHHHQGLTSLDDVAPAMQLKLQNGTWVNNEQIWKSNGATLEIAGSLTGITAENFSRQPGRLAVFIDGTSVHTVKQPASPFVLEILTEKLTAGNHVVIVNWGSEWGPVTGNSFRVSLDESAQKSTANSR